MYSFDSNSNSTILMKRTMLFLLFIFVFSQSILAQNELTETKKLEATAKVWGFLKYYHPQVAEGNYNWDEQLFEILPKVKMASTSEELSQIYIDWIESLGQIKPCKKCKLKKEIQHFNKNFNLDWFNNGQMFNPQVSKKLKHIEENRHLGEKKYVKYYSKDLKIPDFINEIEYKNFDWQDEDLRLLTLFRYWNQIEYFFPAKYQASMNWDDVLSKMIPKFLNPNSEADFHLTMVELAASIDDSHVRLNTEETYLYFGHYYLPVQFKLIDNKAVVTSFYNDSLAKTNDLKIGDIIIEANDKKIEEIFQAQEKYIMGSNISRKRLNASYYVLNGSTDSVKLKIVRDDKTFTKSVKRYLYQDFNYKREVESEKFKVLEDNIGYINIGLVEPKEVSKIMETLENTKAIIFDVRKSSGYTPYFFANYITSQKRDFYKAIVPELDYPGRFIWTGPIKSGSNGKLKYTGKVILLVDENCQSQREFTAMCLQVGDNVTTIGSQTSGANGNVVRLNLVGGYKTQFSGVGIFYPDGTENQRKGVKIDIKVQKSIEGIVEGKDEIYEKAIEYVNE